MEVIHDIFEEQRSLDSVVLRILQRAQRLLLVERAAVSLLEENTLVCLFPLSLSLKTESNTELML